MRSRTLLILLTAVCLAGNAQAADLSEAIAEDYDRHLDALFKHFHQHPELSFREDETAQRLASELRTTGFDVTEGVGGSGVVAVMKNGDGPTLLLRADMDALPLREATGLDYASTVRQVDINGNEMPVMHACGHDVHMTALVGAARRLAAMRDRWQGTLVLIGQPAEELISGARAMIEDGLYERFPKPDYAVAFHVVAGLPAGRIQMEPGLVASSSDTVDIIIHGVGAHGASPHMSKDPVVLGSQIVLALQTLVSREIAPLQPGVVTVGAFHAGTKHNIISDRAELQLTVRADDQAVRQKLLDGIKRIAENAGRMAGLPEDRLPEVIYNGASTPPTVNDADLTARLRSAVASHFGDARMIARPRESMAAEDFSYFVSDTGVPGVYFNVGGTPAELIALESEGKATVPSHHSPAFQIEPEPSVTTGAEAMVVTALELLKKEE